MRDDPDRYDKRGWMCEVLGDKPNMKDVENYIDWISPVDVTKIAGEVAYAWDLDEEEAEELVQRFFTGD
jgi:hypothetical protein